MQICRTKNYDICNCNGTFQILSTNTQPSWQRAHPNRFMVHNGEINTIRGNADKMLAREETMEAGCLKGELHKVLPAINTSGSDSAMLDNTLEFMVMSGMDLPLAVMIMYSGTMGKQYRDVPEQERFLSVLCNNDGAMGWSGIDPVL